MASYIFSLLTFSISLLIFSLPCTANIHQTKTLFRTHSLSENHLPNLLNTTTKPTLFFQVSKPIKIPQKTKPCSNLILQHNFSNTYHQPPVLANYNPPQHCPFSNFSKIVLEWTATCKGRQFDRIFGVWLDGVELLRSCTAEPRANGIAWSVEKDVTKYYSLLMRKNLTLAVYLGNIVDSVYTGVYHVNLTFHFYPNEQKVETFDPGFDHLGNSDSGYGLNADLILPISRNLPLNDGLWFEIENSTDIESKDFRIPQNVYRAVLEVYVSFHENDEFWYGNLPNKYMEANDLSGMPGNGPFREVVVSMDDEVVGAIWPFTVIYTGGINPLLWRPITGIGSFDLPSYDIEITPFLGKILDGKTHTLGFGVTNALNVWYIDANLHLWLDSKSEKTQGKVLIHNASPPSITTTQDFEGLNGKFSTSASRSIRSHGWVKSSYGKITTRSTQEFSYGNKIVMGNHGNMQIVNQTILFTNKVVAKLPSSLIHSIASFRKFPLYMYSDNVNQDNGSYISTSNLTLGYNVDQHEHGGFGFLKSSLRNMQKGQATMVVKDKLVQSGLGSTQEVYRYDGSDSCYFRNVSSSNYTILHDKVRTKCSNKTRPPPFGLSHTNYAFNLDAF